MGISRRRFFQPDENDSCDEGDTCGEGSGRDENEPEPPAVATAGESVGLLSEKALQ